MSNINFAELRTVEALQWLSTEGSAEELKAVAERYGVEVPERATRIECIAVVLEKAKAEKRALKAQNGPGQTRADSKGVRAQRHKAQQEAK